MSGDGIFNRITNSRIGYGRGGLDGKVSTLCGNSGNHGQYHGQNQKQCKQFLFHM